MNPTTMEHTERPDRAVRSTLESTLGLSSPLNTNIHPADDMLNYITSIRGSGSIARSEYFTSGVELLKVLEQLVAWKFGSIDNVGSLLDFASGYGRMTRFLVHKLPADRIWVSDIQAEAVQFQQEEFGVNGFVSTADPADLQVDQTFDCIFVASLFSHLPPARFTAWLDKLYGMLSPGGILVFSANGEHTLPAVHIMPASGIWYWGGSEIASLEVSDYGTTIVTEAYVANAIAAASGRREYARIPYAVLYVQDLYVVPKDPAADFNSLHFTYLPHGSVDYGLWTVEGDLFLRGWVVDFSCEPAELKVQFLTGDRLLGECVPNVPRPDVQQHYTDDRFLLTGWERTIEIPELDAGQPLTVKAVPPGGSDSLLYVGDIASLTPRGKVDSCRWTGADTLYLRGWAVDPSGDNSPVEVQVFVEGTLRQKCMTYMERPDLRQYFNDRYQYAGWECSFRAPNYEPSQRLVVRSVSSSGRETELYVGGFATLEQVAETKPGNADEGPKVNDVLTMDEALQQLQTEREQQVIYIRRLEEEIAHKNEALAYLEPLARRWLGKRRGK